MLGNVWEWCDGGDDQARPLRGGSYVDTLDGSANHALRVSTRMDNSADAGSSNIGFRCASGTADNSEPRQQQRGGRPGGGGGGGGLPPGVDQEMLQQIVAEKGAEGLQEFLQSSGMNANVMTPAQLMERQKEMQKLKAEL